MCANIEGLTDFFTCSVATRQGCILSPFLFIIYLSELIKEVEKCGCQGIFIDETFPNLCLLLYADDIVEYADTVGRLQKLIDTVKLYSDKWGLKVNLDKTNIMVLEMEV